MKKQEIWGYKVATWSNTYFSFWICSKSYLSEISIWNNYLTIQWKFQHPNKYSDLVIRWLSPARFLYKVVVTQLCPTLCNSMDCSPSGPSVPGVFQAKMLEWVTFFFSRGSSRPRDQTQVSHIAGSFFTIYLATGEALSEMSTMTCDSTRCISTNFEPLEVSISNAK